MIESVDNGYIVTDISKDAENRARIAVEDEESDARTTQKLLWEIMEVMGLNGSKHDQERCFVVIKDQNGEEI